MVTLDNKIWLLRNIRDGFISTDDTGLCEIVMAGEDLSKVFAAKAEDERVRIRSEKLCKPTTSRQFFMGNIAEEEHEIVTQFDPYPTMEDSEDDDLLNGSYIRYDEIGGHRQRSNTGQWLDKKEQALKKASKIKVIKWEDSEIMSEDEIAANFTKIDIKKPPKRSMLTELMENCPDLPHMRFMEYAKYDGTAQLGMQTKMFKIFVKLCERYNNYPIVVCIIASARIKDLIGYTCYRYSVEHPDAVIGDLEEYGLCIAEDDGDVDLAFPCLEANEPCSKFGFTCLALIDVKKRDRDPANVTSSLPEDGIQFGGFMYPKASDSGASIPNTSRHNTGGSATSEAVKSALEAVNEGLKKADLKKMHTHKMATEAPQYKTYRVYMLRRIRASTLIQLGISLDKVEVEPLTGYKHAFWSQRPKYSMHSIDSIAWCQMLEVKGNKCVFRIVYTDEQNPTTYDRNTSFFHSNNTYKYHDFETDHATAKEIVDKVNTILEFRNSPCRREYKTAKEKKLNSRRSFHSRHLSSS